MVEEDAFSIATKINHMIGVRSEDKNKIHRRKWLKNTLILIQRRINGLMFIL